MCLTTAARLSVVFALQWSLILLSLTAEHAHADQARSPDVEHQCLGEELPANSFEHSLLQAKSSRSRLRSGTPDQGQEPRYGPEEADRAFRDDLVGDRDHDIDSEVDDSSNDDLPVPGDLREEDEEDSDFALDDYKSGSPQRLCWIPPEVDAYGTPVIGSHGHVLAPVHVQCPPQCPYTQGIPEDKCYKACVKAHQCRTLHPFRVFGDKITLQCTPTCGLDEEDFVEGCVQCAKTGICKKCSFWRRLSKDGRKCTDYWLYIWVFLSYLAKFMFLLFLSFLLYLHCKPIISPALWQRAARHRDLTQPWCLETRPWQGGQIKVRKHGLLAKTHEDNVSGMGMALYFRWTRFMLLAAVLLALIMYITFHVSLEVVTADKIRSVNVNGTLNDVLGFFQAAAVEKSEVDARQGPPAQLVVVTEPELCRYGNNGLPAILPTASKAQTGSASFLQANETVGKPTLRGFKKVKFKFNLGPKAKVKLKAKAKMPMSMRDEEPIDVPAGSYDNFPLRMTLACFFAYVVLTGLSLAYARWQSLFEKRWRVQHRAHRDFTILVAGLPANATDPAELKKFFQAALDSAPKVSDREAKSDSQLQVIEVSIAYDYTLCEQRMPEWMALLVDNIETTLTERFPDDPKLAIPAASTDASDLPAPSRLNPYEYWARRWLPPAEEQEADAEEKWQQEARKSLQEIQCSGNAYVVVSTMLARDRLLALDSDRLRWRGAGSELGGELLSLSACTVEPPSIIWEAHGHVPSKTQMARNTAMLVGTVLLWALSFAPYAHYQIQARAVPGQELNSSTDFVLGTLVALGNNLVYIMINFTTHHFGLVDKENLDTMTMALIYVATVTNTVLDIGIVLLVLRGYSLESAMHGYMDQSHYDRVLATELFSLLVPGYLITPYVFAPLVEDMLPAYAKKRLIRSSAGVSQFCADRNYMRVTFDLAWHYSDLLTNMTVCLPLLIFGTHHMYAIMLWLLACYCLTYCIDHFRLLRATTLTWQCTNQLDIAFSYWWSVPTGALGAIALFWAMEAEVIRPYGLFGKMILFIFVVLHCICYCYGMRALRSTLQHKDLDDGMSYEAMCKGHWQDFRFYNYINTNPVQVLRSWLLPNQEERVPFVLGKEHLMLLDPAIGKQKDTLEAILKRMEAAEANTRSRQSV